MDQEDRYGEHQVVVLADSLWQRRFGGDPSVIGRKIILGGSPYTVVGVLPPDFEFPKQPTDIGKRLTARMEMFRPLAYQPEEMVPHGGDLNYAAIARLRPGVSMERAVTELTAVEAAMDSQVKDLAWHILPVMTPLQQRLTGDVRQSLIVLMAAVGAVLLVLCVNLANLSLSRAAGRGREAAIRTALGASRWQLARQSLEETGVISAARRRLWEWLLAFVGLQHTARRGAYRHAALERCFHRCACVVIRAGDFGRTHGAPVRDSAGFAQRFQRRAVRDAEIHQLCERRRSNRLASAQCTGGSRSRLVRGAAGNGRPVPERVSRI